MVCYDNRINQLVFTRCDMNPQDQIERFLDGSSFAVVGASQNRAKYGNKVLRAYQQQNLTVYPVHPAADEVEGLKVYRDLASLPQPVHGVSIITPPNVTEQVVDEAIQAGIQHLWMQPGAESQTAIERAENAGISVIAGGPCLLVVVGYHE